MPSHFTNAPSPKRRKRGKGKLWIIPVVLLVLVAAVYFGGVAAFNMVFLPGTTLDGADVSLRKVDDVATEKSSTFDGFETHVTGDGLDLTVRASDIGLTCDGEAYAKSALAQTNPWAWPFEVAQKRSLTAEAGAEFDRDKLAALIQPVVDESAAVAEELGGSGITFDADAAAFVLDERVVASHLDVDATIERLTQAFDAREKTVELGDDSLKSGSAPAEALRQANAYVAATQSLTLAGTEAYLLDAATIAPWVTIGDDLSVTLDTQAINDFCHGALTNALDTVGTERTYTRPDGTTFTVADTNPHYSRSTYGWIIDGDACAQQISDALQSGQAGSIELACVQSAAQFSPGGQDWGPRYIDVNLTTQHAVFYDADSSVIWEADITTGQPNLDQETPTGVWTITNRKSRATDGDISLRGPLDPETGEYEWEAHVDFWCGVVGNLVGFHNAPLQHTFGGNVYTYMGSHGCIRMNYANAEALYNLAQVGDTVVIHK